MERKNRDVLETRVLLLRHAETADTSRFHGAESDIGLGAWGRRQAEIVARELVPLRPAALFCSAMRRALDTADPIGLACGLTPEVVPALHERRMGPLSGVLLEEGIAAYEEAKARWCGGDLDYTHEGGESYREIRARVVPPFLELTARHPGKTLVVIAHGVVIRVLLTTLLEGYSPQDFDHIGIANCAINDLRYDGLCWHAEALNREPEELKREQPDRDLFNS